jgi:hypothetical protein
VGSGVDVIWLLWCGIVGGLLFAVCVIGRVGVVPLFGSGLGVACSRIVGVLCVWWLHGIVFLPLGRRSDCMNPYLMSATGK